jgi:hypothetical protein
VRSTLRSRLRSTLRSERRLPVAAGAAVTVLAVAVLGGCTGSGSSDGADGDGGTSPADGTSFSPAPPGKYRTLPQPCTAVDLDSLKELVPGAKDYAGAESLTYDTNRLVGCTWKGTAADGTSSTLSLSMVRVVSYDPTVSDEAEAKADFAKKAEAASVSLTPPSGTPATPTDPPATSGTPDPTGTATGAGTPTGTTTGTPNGANGTDSVNSTSPDLAPRALRSVGNAAFINDVLTTPKAGPRRTVTLVFRTANVLATVSYTQSSPSDAGAPKSADLQKAAQKVAGELEGKVKG